MERKNTWPFKFESKLGNEVKEYAGTFTSKILSFKDKTQVKVRTSQLCGGFYCVRDDEGEPTGRGIDSETEWNSYMLATLEACLIQKPLWFKLDGDDALVDGDLIFAIFKEASKYERRFRGLPDEPVTDGTGDGGPAQSGEGNSADKPAQANSGSVPKRVVDREVQASLEP